MGAIILRVLTMVLGGGAASAIMGNLSIIGIAAAVVLVTNAVSGVVWYVKGHNAAAAKCNVNTLIVERDQLKRDVGIANRVATDTAAKLTELQGKEALRAQREVEDATKDKPIEGCVITDPLPATGRVRNRNRR